MRHANQTCYKVLIRTSKKTLLRDWSAFCQYTLAWWVIRHVLYLMTHVLQHKVFKWRRHSNLQCWKIFNHKSFNFIQSTQILFLKNPLPNWVTMTKVKNKKLHHWLIFLCQSIELQHLHKIARLWSSLADTKIFIMGPFQAVLCLAVWNFNFWIRLIFKYTYSGILYFGFRFA